MFAKTFNKNNGFENTQREEIEDEIEVEIDDEIIETDPDENVHHPLLDDDPSIQEPKSLGPMSKVNGFSL